MSNDYQIMLGALERENERLRDEIERNRKEIDGLIELLRKDRAEIESLKDTISEILKEVRGR